METTLFPLATLPACAKNCGPLFDVNGACVPPAKPTAAASVYDACFCGDSRLAAFSAGTAGVCDSACTASPAGLGSIRNWYTSFCSGKKAVAPQTTSTKGSGGSGGSSAGSSSGGKHDWLSTHYKWVIFLVVMVVAIAGIWIGACIWRRRYLRKKDRQYALGKRLAHFTSSGRVVPNASQAASIHVPSAGMFEPAPLSAAGVYDGHSEKPNKVKQKKKKWVVTERT